jgi:RimJ/RimL family protein N-acetyltransferase
VNVTLREVIETDLPVFFEHQRDEEAVRMAAFASRDREAFMAHWTKILANPACHVTSILADGRLAGHVCAFDRDGRRLVGYWIGKEYWGRGVATAGLAAFVTLERVRPLYAYVAVANVGSVRVLEKCGFEAVGEPEAVDGVAEWTMRLDAARRS